VGLAVLDKPRTLVFPLLEGSRTLQPGARGGLWEAARALARGDTARVRKELIRVDPVLHQNRPGDVAMEFTLQEATLLVRLGDSSGAALKLDRVLGALPTLGTDLLTEVPQAAALVRAMALRADLAARRSETPVAVRWARAVSTLWAHADPGFAPTLDRMRSIAGG
jgi:hypothetical protein